MGIEQFSFDPPVFPPHTFDLETDGIKEPIVVDMPFDQKPLEMQYSPELITDTVDSFEVSLRLVANSGLLSIALYQRGGSLNNIKQNLIKQKKANAKPKMSPEQKRLRRSKRKRR